MEQNVINVLNQMFSIVQELNAGAPTEKIECAVRRAKTEIRKFLLYLSASDGSIEDKEADFLNDNLNNFL